MPEITDAMIEAGAKILDPMLSSDCPKRVARDVYAAMREAEGARDGKPVGKPVLRGCDGRPIDWKVVGYLSHRSVRLMQQGPETGMQRPAATSDGRW